jgi:hypothetical protein
MPTVMALVTLSIPWLRALMKLAGSITTSAAMMLTPLWCSSVRQIWWLVRLSLQSTGVVRVGRLCFGAVVGGVVDTFANEMIRVLLSGSMANPGDGTDATSQTGAV